MQRHEALGFFKQLERSPQQLPPPAILTPLLDQLVSGRDVDRDKHLFRREAAFVNGYVVPRLFELIQLPEHLGPDKERARKALLNEHLVGMESYTEATGAWLAKHPFSKKWPGDAAAIYDEWAIGRGISDCWPDIALNDPALPRAVFECKYFMGGSESATKGGLVKDLYQAVFYRGLPPLPAKGGRRGWNCDYACLIAYDASSDGRLRQAWGRLPAFIRESFWDGAQVYPIIFGGN